MKALSFALCFLMATSAAFAADDKPELVKIQTVDGKSVWVTKDVLKETYNEAFGKPKGKLSAVEKARFSLQVRQAAYKWAYSGDGMNRSAGDAQAFAEDMTSRENPVEAFEAYKAAYLYAYSGAGLNRSAEDARNLAEKLSKLDSPIEMLEVFKTAYKNAYSGSGMNLSAEASLNYALKSVGLK